MVFNILLLPNEIINIIVSNLEVKDAKNVSLTSKRMYKLTLSRIWASPRLSGLIDIEHLKQISQST